MARNAAVVAWAIVVLSSGAQAETSPELAARMAQEKDARRACKIEICKAFAAPTEGAPITCNVTKTWLKSEITQKIVGGSYVWGYGHLQCTLGLSLDRAEIAKAMSPGAGKGSFAEHAATCNVDDADPGKGTAFTVKVTLTPVVAFEKREAKTVVFEPIKTEGSGIAAAAVTSLLAIDKVSGSVSRAAAGEINAFLYEKCQADGVSLVRN
jgi:hypothetical protein